MTLLHDQHLFWDTDITKLRPDNHAQAIIERVLERGSWEYIKEIIGYYGKPRIASAVRQARWFSAKTMHFASGYFNIPLNEMRCFTQRQSSPIPYL